MIPPKWHRSTQSRSLSNRIYSIIPPASSDLNIYELTVSKTTNFTGDYFFALFCANMQNHASLQLLMIRGNYSHSTHAVKLWLLLPAADRSLAGLFPPELVVPWPDVIADAVREAQRFF